MFRGLRFYWRIHLAVAAAVAVCGAVITGALLVGDSIRGSLRDLTLDRLGHIDAALVAERFFADNLPERLLQEPGFEERFDGIAPAILLRGSAQHTVTRARASSVSVLGIDERFLELYADPPVSATFIANAGIGPARLDFSRADRQTFATAVINESLAGELGAAAGDAVLLHFRLGADVPRDTLLGERGTEDVIGSLRVTVREIVPDRGAGRFDLSPQQSSPLLAFIGLGDLQRAVEQPGRANALFVSRREPGTSMPDLDGVLDLADLGLQLTQLRGNDRRTAAVELHSERMVLDATVAAAALQAADDVGGQALALQAYVVNEMALGERRVPYSMVMALDPVGATGFDTAGADGLGGHSLADDEILLNDWTASQLGATLGDTVAVSYFVVGADETLRTERRELRVAGVVPMRGLAVDGDLMPPYPGIEDADDISMWDPPFPVDLSAIRPQDEAYWDEWRGAPKAFVSTATGEALWATRYGATTAVRIVAPEGIDLDQLQRSYAAALRTRLAPADFGYTFLDTKNEGLAAASGATDFGGLFIGFSFFIIVAATLIVALLFALGIEQRAREAGLLRALGFPLRSVRRRLMAEGALVAAAGAALGLAGALAYARLMLLGLTTVWLPAVGSPLLFLHPQAATLTLGMGIAAAVALAAMRATLGRLGRVAPPRLLSGSFLNAQAPSLRRTRRATVVALASGGGAAALLAWGIATGAATSPAIAFGAGALLLTCGLAWFSAWCRSTRGDIVHARSGALLAMAARNTGWNPRRSQLGAGLVAAACFVIVTVAGNVRDPSTERSVIDEGAGGYELVATTDVPLHDDLSSVESRFDLGLDAPEFDSLRVAQLRMLPGDDASCLNLYRPQRPRLLGVPDAQIQRGGFHFAGMEQPPPDADNPWSLLQLDLGADVVPAIGDANSVQWILHLGLGDELAITDERGRPVRLRIVGTLRESVFQSELLIAEKAFLRLFPSRAGFSYFLVGGPADRIDEVAERLEAGLVRYGFDATPAAQKLAGFLMVQNTYLATFQMLGGLGLLLGTVGLAIVLARSVIERRGELATLRAFGFPLRFLGRLVLAENAFLLVVGVAIGTAASLLAISPRYVLGAAQVPWSTLVPTLAAVIVVGMSASIVAVRAALRSPLLHSLKQDR